MKEYLEEFYQLEILVDKGCTVYWKNDGYKVIKSGEDYLIKFHNGNCVGLHEPSYDPSEFYFYPENSSRSI